MENHDNPQEFNLDDLLNEFLSAPDEQADGAFADVDLDSFLKDFKELDTPSAPEPTVVFDRLPQAAAVQVPPPAVEPSADAAVPAKEAPADAAQPEAEPAAEPVREAAASDDAPKAEKQEAEPAEPDIESPDAESDTPTSQPDTIRLDNIADVKADEAPKEASEEEAAPAAEAEKPAEATDSAAEEPAKSEPIPFSYRNKLHELKRKLIAGPEKRYYDLSEQGVGKIQVAILLNALILILCIAATTLFTMGMVPENRLRLVIFSQVLAMLVSALLGSQQLLDGIAEIFRARFSINTLLFFTLLACCADAVFCLKELRVPCCACFTMEMTFAMLGRYHRRSTEMARMDTLRKASKLRSIVKEPDVYNGKSAILRGEGDVEDFMDTYAAASTPEKVQSIYCFIALILSLGIASLAGLRHTPSLAVQILSTSLLVAVPASFFVALTRPAALLERRLHMVGSVICGWQGVVGLKGRAVFPIRDTDLFPASSVKLNGVKFYSSREPEEILSYTTSLIAAAGGGLVPVFRNMLANRGGKEYPVADFRNYENGGIGGMVEGEPVLLGTLNFLQDMGVEIPQGTMVNQAVYAAIDGELCAVVAISYAKMHFAAAGLVSLCGCRRLKPVMVGGDFMLTKEFLRSKFSVNAKRIEFPEHEARTALASRTANSESKVLALATRDDLASTVYAITGAGALRTASVFGVVIHLFGGIIGLLIMAALAYIGSVDLLTPTHVLLYQLVWMLPGLLVTEWTRAV